MSTEREEERFPSIGEYNGLFNIPDQYDDHPYVLRTVEPLPEFGFPEFWKVYRTAEKWFAQVAAELPPRPPDPLADPPFFAVSDADDRTLTVEVDFACLSLPLLERIQRELLGRFPLWRVHFIGEDDSTGIVVYPLVIRLGDRPIAIDQQAALAELIARGLELRAAREKPMRDHVARIERLLPAAVRAISERPFYVCGVLDNYEGDYSRLTICLLVRGTDENVVTLEGPDATDDDFFRVSGCFGVNAKGEIISHIDVPESAPFCLMPWMPPADYRGPIWIVERESGRRHRFEIRSEDIIRTR